VGFKDDARFAHFLTLGVEGTAVAAADLSSHHGHSIIELERSSMANKIWRTKPKRLRLPDLMCVRCGMRIESRSKSKLQMELSDSHVVGREWHNDSRPEDLVAFVQVDLDQFTLDAAPGPPAYFTIGALSRTRDHAKHGRRKATREGSELSLVWPTKVATQTGTITEVTDDVIAIAYTNLAGKPRTSRLSLEGLTPYVSVGSPVIGRKSFIAGIAKPAQGLTCPGPGWDPRNDLSSPVAVDRYAAVKAIRAGRFADTESLLTPLAKDPDQRVRMEAAGTLTRLGHERAAVYLGTCALEPRKDGMAMEAVLILAEAEHPIASAELRSVAANERLPAEMRCAAVWGLGMTGLNRPQDVWPYVTHSDDDIRMHAIAAIDDIPDDFAQTLVDELSGATPRAAIAAYLLANGRRIFDLAKAAHQPASRKWAVEGLGRVAPAEVEATSALDDELRTVLEPVWTTRFGQPLASKKTTARLRELHSQRMRIAPEAYLR